MQRYVIFFYSTFLLVQHIMFDISCSIILTRNMLSALVMEDFAVWCYKCGLHRILTHVVQFYKQYGYVIIYTHLFVSGILIKQPIFSS